MVRVGKYTIPMDCLEMFGVWFLVSFPFLQKPGVWMFGYDWLWLVGFQPYVFSMISASNPNNFPSSKRIILEVITLPETNSEFTPENQSMVGRWFIPFGFRPTFRCVCCQFQVYVYTYHYISMFLGNVRSLPVKRGVCLGHPFPVGPEARSEFLLYLRRSYGNEAVGPTILCLEDHPI